MNFDEIYKKIYAENIEELKRYHTQQTIQQIVIALILLIIYIIIFIYIPNIIPLGIISYIIITITCFNIFKNKKYTEIFKKRVITSIIKNYNESFKYQPQIGIPSADYLQADFEQVFSHYYSEDCITGILQNNSELKMAEITLEKDIQKADGKVSHVTIFSGLFTKINTLKDIPATIQIRKNSPQNLTSLQHIEMDSLEFEKLYNVYTDNSIISMQIFTADIMQMLLDFKNDYKIFPEITIKQNYIYLRFKLKKGLFEPKLFKKVLDYKEIEKNYQLINSIINLCSAFLKNIIEIDF